MQQYKTNVLPVICMWTASILYVSAKIQMAHNTIINIDKYIFQYHYNITNLIHINFHNHFIVS
jgi:hypothetical protein